MGSISTDKHWFAASTKPKQEKAIRDKLNEIGIENFIPTKVVVRQWKYRKQKVELPVIPHLVFVRTDFATSFSLLNDYGIQMKYIKSYETRTSLVIPDWQMENFMRVVNSKNASLCFEPSQMHKGDKVRVVAGPFIGLEGELIDFSGKKKVIVDLKGVVAVTFDITEGDLEKIL
ncbi:MAG: UpxY family transcription antiterminator [Bacteroidales bacterium]|nr:UpxY family transcription antiterminator [Bacteroidales bacterium]